ncbi:MAG: 2-C-methyl-D-erythritol 4-phosphate cytidylyltransferase [Turicibacter sp.]
MYSAIVLSAGMGSRMKLGYNKMLHEIDGVPVVIMTLKKFLHDQKCGQLLLVVNPLEIDQMNELLIDYKIIDHRISLVSGGSERQYSVYNGLEKATQDIILVHDGARPFVTQTMMDECVELATQGKPSIVAVPVKDTMKRVVNGEVVETLNRDEMYAVQTPQAAPTQLLRRAHELAKDCNFLGTDEASLIEKYTESRVLVVKGSYTNIKLTTPEDLIIAKQFIKGSDNE